MKLLIVDDSKVIRDRLRAMLYDVENVEVIGEAANYCDAMNAISTTFPGIVILDINMPGKNGLDLLLELKTMINPPVAIMMSNYSDIYYRNLCEKMGADYFFDKSTEFEKIPDVLNALVRL
jgi:DNA-binding NarL/FixJ family response regulator